MFPLKPTKDTRLLSAVKFWAMTCLLLTPNGTAFAGKVSIEDEISESKRSFNNEFVSPEKKRMLELYTETLESLKELNPQNLTYKKDIKIDETAKGYFLDALNKMQHFFDPELEINLVSLYQMFEFIEDNKDTWKTEKKKEAFFNLKKTSSSPKHLAPQEEQKIEKQEEKQLPTEAEQRDELNVKIQIDQFGSIYLDFGVPKKIHKGLVKKFERVFAYKTWERVAHGRFRYLQQENYELFFQEQLNGFNNELKILDILFTLPPEEREGLVEVYSYQKDHIFQKMYDFNLSKVIHPDGSTETGSDQILDILSQISKGIATLHRKKIAHSDIQLGNVLLIEKHVLGRTFYEAAVSDFGSAFHVGELLNLKQKPPVSGTAVFMAPEIRYNSKKKKWKVGWTGKTPEEKMENALKRDVFSVAAITALALKPYLVPWITKTDCKAMTSLIALQCKQMELDHLFDKTVPHLDLDPLEQLIVWGLEPNPRKRITSKQWSDALEVYINAQEIFKISTENKDKTSRNEIVRTWSGIDQFENMTQEKATDTLNKKNLGQYKLIPINFGNAYAPMRLVYVDSEGKIQFKKIAFNPSHPERTLAEVNLLVAAGVLKRDKNLKPSTSFVKKLIKYFTRIQ